MSIGLELLLSFFLVMLVTAITAPSNDQSIELLAIHLKSFCFTLSFTNLSRLYMNFWKKVPIVYCGSMD